MSQPGSAQLKSAPYTGALPPIAWAAFLGSSWTWCIGMFLPVLLVRDYGIAGWVIFAIPNVVGAAAMGWVLSDHRQSTTLTWRHEIACIAFSVVTIAFHCFFVGWIVQTWIGWSAPLLVIAGAFIVLLLGARENAGDVIAALVVLAVSIMMAAMAQLHRPAAITPGTGDTSELLALAAACLFGFALCPYLDLTFHRARQSTDGKGARVAFGIGFGVLFLSMILTTLLYVPPMVRLLRGDDPGVSNTFRTVIALHLIAQCGLTIALHLRELLKRFTTLALLGSGASIVLFVLSYLIGLRFSLGETVYRIFMGFYGLIFPAYAWLCMLPLRKGGLMPNPRRIVIFAISVALTLPLFWIGFIEGRMIWLVPGVGIVLLARLLVQSKEQQAQPSVQQKPLQQNSAPIS